MNVKAGNKRLQFWDACIVGGRLFFSARNFNGLFCLERDRTVAEFIGRFPEETVWQKNLHRQVISIGDKLYFIPFQGTGVSIFNRVSGDFFYVNIGEKKPVEISRAFTVGDDIFMVPLNLKKPFVLFHTVDNTYELKWELQKKILEQFPQIEKICFGGYGSCAIEQKIYLTVSDTNIVLSLDLNTQQVDTYKLPAKYKLRNIYYDGGRFYFTLSNQCKVISWDLNTEKYYEYIIEDRANTVFHPYMTVLRWKNQLLLLPDRADKIWKLDEEKDIWCIWPNYIPDGFGRIRESVSLFLGYQYIDDALLLLPWAGNGMLSLSENECKCHEIHYSDDLVGLVRRSQEEFVEALISQDLMPIYENEEEYINMESVILALNNNFTTERKKQSDNVGSKIWDYFR